MALLGSKQQLRHPRPSSQGRDSPGWGQAGSSGVFVHTSAKNWAQAAPPGPNPKESEHQEPPKLPWDPSTPCRKSFPCIPRGSALTAMLIKEGFHKFSLFFVFFCSSCKGIKPSHQPKRCNKHSPQEADPAPTAQCGYTPAGLIN